MSMKFYSGNYSFQTKYIDLGNFFSQAGNARSAGVIEDQEIGYSCGFSFVEMSSTVEGNKAIKQFSGKEFDDRSFNVNNTTRQCEVFAGSLNQRAYDGNRNGVYRGGRSNRW